MENKTEIKKNLEYLYDYCEGNIYAIEIVKKIEKYIKMKEIENIKIKQELKKEFEINNKITKDLVFFQRKEIIKENEEKR